MKYIHFYFYFLTIVANSQIIDSLKSDKQQFKINNNITFEYSKPKTWDMFRYIPNDMIGLGTFAIQKENLKWDALALGSTIALVPYDQKIVNDASKIGEKIGGWDNDSRYERILGIEILPTSLSSGVYYLGNGNTTLLLSGMFYAIGKIGKDDYRALTTSNELIEALLSVGVVTQSIKRVSGRQSPKPAINSGLDGGEWHLLPSFSSFQKNTPNYDAMPSGHLATYMATITIIATNYPEIKWIKPVGYSLGSLLAFNMISGKVHWASDYPLAILIGYAMGKNIANRRIQKKENTIDLGIKKTKFKTNYTFSKIYDRNLIGISITF
jgi:PAP2 superfamily